VLGGWRARRASGGNGGTFAIDSSPGAWSARVLLAGLSAASVTASDTDVNTDTRRDRSHSSSESAILAAVNGIHSHTNLPARARIRTITPRYRARRRGRRGKRLCLCRLFTALVHSSSCSSLSLSCAVHFQAPMLAIARVDGEKKENINKSKSVARRECRPAVSRRDVSRGFDEPELPDGLVASATVSSDPSASLSLSLSLPLPILVLFLYF